MISQRHMNALERIAAKRGIQSGRIRTSEGDVRVENGVIVEERTDRVPWQFARVVVINRPDRRDRREALETHLREIGWPFATPLWHAATPGEDLTPPVFWNSTRNTWANLQSHLQVIREAYEAGDESVLVMEDDCLYLPGFLERVSRFMREAPDDWGMLMLGGRAGVADPQIAKVTSDIWRIGGWNNLESYAVHRRAMVKVIDTLATATEHSDVALHRIQFDAPTYHMNPPIATQRAGMSDNFGHYKGYRQGRLDVWGTEGAMILSAGENRRHLLANSTASLRRNNPQLGLKVFSDRVWVGYDCEVVEDATGFGSRSVKTQMLCAPAFPSGIMLDDDTVTLGPLPSVASVLGDCELALAPDRFQSIRALFTDRSAATESWLGVEEREFTLSAFPDAMEMPHWNTGVIFYRDTPSVREFSKVWHEEWLRFGRIDQIAFVRAVIRTGIRIATLPPQLHQICSEGSAPRGTLIAHVIGPKWEISKWLDANRLPIIQPPAEVREGCCGGKRRTLAGMASDLGKTIGGAVSDALRGRRVKISEAELQARRSACMDCDRREGNRCGECGCFLSLAQPLARKQCPLGKWPVSSR